jgi:acetyl esterase
VTLHPQIAQMIDVWEKSGLPPITELTPEDARARSRQARAAMPPGPEVASLEALRVPVGGGESIAARHYVPHGEHAGLVVYLHGGGWVLGHVDDYDTLCSSLAVAARTQVLSVDYRLAPEHRFPTAADDAYAALRWAAETLAEGQPLVVVGDSAGGNLAAVCAQRAAADGLALALQVLVYPVADHDFDRDSYRRYGTGFMLGRAEMVWFWDHYVPNRDERSDPRASPLRAESLGGLAPALVVLAENDVLRDEGVAYAERLSQAGVPVELSIYDDVIHGFFANAAVLDRGAEALDEVAAAIRDSVGAAART